MHASRTAAVTCALALAGGVSGQTTTTLFGPYVEWSAGVRVLGNRFDVLAEVTFTHAATGKVRTTEMFHDPATSAHAWKWRFTGTRTGAWTYSTTSSVPGLNGLTGTVQVNPCADPSPRGFLVATDGTFARQVGETGLRGEAMHVYMNMREPNETNPGFGINDRGGWTPVNRWDEAAERAAYIGQARDNGFDAIFLQINAQWFEANVADANLLSRTDPDPVTFAALEKLIVEAHAAGIHVVIWAWGDDARKWTPNFAPLDGQNGTADRRLQRYIAARLGPLPGWSMGYGFDLEEWASEAEVQTWADFLRGKMGWDHLLWGRRRSNASLDVVSNDLRPDGSPEDEFYDTAVDALNGAGARPVIFERRFGYLRDGVWTADNTRRSMWQFTMAGGAAGWYGFRAGTGITATGPYPNPEQLRTHHAFWEERLQTGMARHNELAPDDQAWAMATSDLSAIVVYAQNRDEVALNLSGLAGPVRAIAVDTQASYTEVDLGLLQPVNQIWMAPHVSDWAIAALTGTPEVPTLSPPGLGALAVGLATFSAWLGWAVWTKRQAAGR